MRTRLSTAFITLILAVFSITAAGALPLIGTDQLAGSVGRVTLIDIRPADEYTAGHIPGAVNLPFDRWVTKAGDIPNQMPPVDVISKTLGEAGLTKDANMVLYSSTRDPMGLTAGTLAFWTLEYLGAKNVSLLDGGSDKWKAEKRAMSTDPVPPKPAVFTAQPDEKLNVTTDYVASSLNKPSVLLLDMRAADQYFGVEKNPITVRYGHIPGAKDLPILFLVQGDYRTFRPEQELKTILQSLGLTPDKQLVSYCNTGREASFGYFAGRLAGYPNVTMYHGSMADWSRRSDLPLVRYKWE